MVLLEHRRFALSRLARVTIVAVLLATLGTALLAGCAERGPVYVEGGSSRTKATALVALTAADTSAVASRPD